jgi:hypothetical protein
MFGRKNDRETFLSLNVSTGLWRQKKPPRTGAARWLKISQSWEILLRYGEAHFENCKL